MKSKRYHFFIWGIRFFLGIIFFTSGMSKLTHGNFPGLIGPVWLTDELRKYGLEYLGEFIAWSQVVIGLLLLTQRFATLGAIMLLPMLLNIFMVMLSIGIHDYEPGNIHSTLNTSVINAFFLFLNFILLAHDFHKLKFIFYDDDLQLNKENVRRKSFGADRIVIAGSVICLIAPLFYSISLTTVYILAGIGLLICITAPFFWKKKSQIN
jgi:uncharacterized membrane protein YphA (DoxX/SURF4 family)